MLNAIRLLSRSKEDIFSGFKTLKGFYASYGHTIQAVHMDSERGAVAQTGNLLSQLSIRLATVPAGTHEGGIESEVRYLREAVRSMVYDAPVKLPGVVMPYALEYAVMVRNAIPRGDKEVSPAVLFKGESRVDRFRTVFGQPAMFYEPPTATTTSVDPRARFGIYLGPASEKGSIALLLEPNVNILKRAYFETVEPSEEVKQKVETVLANKERLEEIEMELLDGRGTRQQDGTESDETAKAESPLVTLRSSQDNDRNLGSDDVMNDINSSTRTDERLQTSTTPARVGTKRSAVTIEGQDGAENNNNGQDLGLPIGPRQKLQVTSEAVSGARLNRSFAGVSRSGRMFQRAYCVADYSIQLDGCSDVDDELKQAVERQANDRGIDLSDAMYRQMRRQIKETVFSVLKVAVSEIEEEEIRKARLKEIQQLIDQDVEYPHTNK